MLKDLQKEIETTFWMRYEKRKMKECVNTLHNLASAFLIEEKQEEEKDRYRLFLKKRLKEKLANYKEKEATLTEQIEQEKQRAEEIEEFEKYTKTKKYIEDVAREKLGLVYEDEIIIQTEDD